MQEIFERAAESVQNGEPCVLATVVRTTGMTPQKAGARQLFLSDGTAVGTLGGGCVEGDIWYRARQILKKEAGPEFHHYHLNADIAEQDGLVCGGNMYFYLQPLWPQTSFLDAAQEIVHACEAGPPVALATVVAPPESPHFGAMMLIRQDATFSGTLGDPELEEIAAKTAQKFMRFGGCELLRAPDGTEVFVEGFAQPPTLVILGGGHVGKAVYDFARMVGFRVIIVDDRPEFANAQRFPHAAQTVVAEFGRAFEKVEIGANAFILVATRGHRFDDAATRAAVNTPARYIGLLGSKRKNLLIFKELRQAGVPEERIAEIHAPVGLDIGAITREEIALSIVSEMVKELRGGKGRSLKMAATELRKYLASITK